MPNISDAEAIQKVRNGEIDCFSPIVTKYTKSVLVFISRSVYDKSEVEDLVQETFLKFYKYINKFDTSRPVLPYLFQIAKNEVRMYIRSKKHTLQLDENIQIEATEEENFTDMEDALASLAPEQRKALELVYEGHSYQEIATILKRPINTVRTIIRRARLLLKSKNT
jgi:RNA polymerase sigma-70 factor (ECF subfamily)